MTNTRLSKRRTRERAPNVRVGVDTGGTFTDFVYEVDSKLQVFKLASTPSDPSLAITAGLKQISEQLRIALDKLEVVHGTTVGTNALLQRRGARIALITTKGFEDVLAIGRQARPELYNLDAVKPAALVSDELRLGVPERISATGEVLQPLRKHDLDVLVRLLKGEQVDAIAICLLFSFVTPDHEKRIARALSPLKIPLSISHEILPEYREFERTSTVTINAYLQPLMGRYLKRLAANTPRLRVMQSSGGSISATVAAQQPVRTILSGPSGGVVGALRVARAAGFEKIITFDMGGTSTDVALCIGDSLTTTNEATIAGLPVAVPVLDIHTVGAGGGSIARVDEGGSLRVGPESAGADPGPACYGRSLLPTVTDAHLVLGHFGGAGLLGGAFELDEKRSHDALRKLASAMSKAAKRNITDLEAAHGVISVANSNMEGALRKISIERGHDSREFALMPFGGAGGLHAVDLARALHMPRIIVPEAGGALSAVGVLTADVLKDQTRTVMLKLERGVDRKLLQTFSEMEKIASADLKQEGFASTRQRHVRSLALRYQGQSFELEVSQTSGDIAKSFHAAHRERYGYEQDNEIEIVTARLRSVGIVEKLATVSVSKSRKASKPARFVQTYIDGKRVRTAVYERDQLLAGSKLQVPCIVIEYSATTLIRGGVSVSVDRCGNVIIDRS